MNFCRFRNFSTPDYELIKTRASWPELSLHKITLHSNRAKYSILLYKAWCLIFYKDAVLVEKFVFKIIQINIAIQSDNQVFLVFAHYISIKVGIKLEH